MPYRLNFIGNPITATDHFRVAECFLSGIVVEQDKFRGHYHLTVAAYKGNREAQQYLKYKEHKKINDDYLAYPIIQLKLSADLGSIESQYNLAVCYNFGQQLASQDLLGAFKYYKLAADQGHRQSQYKVGTFYDNGIAIKQNNVKALRYYHLAAKQGDAESQNILGTAYRDGIGVVQNSGKALIYFAKAIDQGNINAMYNLGTCYDQGILVTKNLQQAFRYYKLAADQGFVDAQYNVAVCYKSGNGVAINLDMAFKYFKLSADQGNFEAQSNVGIFYYYGIVVSQDVIKAFNYYKLAADKGSIEAQNNLGMCYFTGTGTEQNYQQAYKYLKLSTDSGGLNAWASLGLFFCDEDSGQADHTSAVSCFKSFLEISNLKKFDLSFKRLNFPGLNKAIKDAIVLRVIDMSQYSINNPMQDDKISHVVSLFKRNNCECIITQEKFTNDESLVTLNSNETISYSGLMQYLESSWSFVSPYTNLPITRIDLNLPQLVTLNEESMKKTFYEKVTNLFKLK